MPSASTLPSDGHRPRAMVIDGAWRGIGAEPGAGAGAGHGPGSGVESLSGPGGAPLTRTVKLIVLPLIVRPALRPELAADFLAPREADRLAALIRESGALLAATAQWFTLLKKTRRALGIVAGNPQDLYFQRCFELAAEHGTPSGAAGAVARAVVEEIAEVTVGRTVAALKEHLRDGGRWARLDGELAATWAAGRAGADGSDAGAGVGLGAVVGLAGEVLEACGAGGSGGRPGAGGSGGRPGAGPLPEEGSSGFADMVRGGHGSLLGRALWARTSGVWGRDDVPTHLGLTAHQAPPRPEVGRSASTATLPAPLDRTLFERLFTVLQTSAHREELPTVPELVRREVGRSCAPLGLYDESLRVAVVLGGRLAVGLDPLGGGGSGAGAASVSGAAAASEAAAGARGTFASGAAAGARGTVAPGAAAGVGGAAAPGATAAHRVVNSRWQREASVLRARRMTLSPRPDPDGGALEALAHDLRNPWSAYMRRLWVRLHGRDVRGAGLPDAGAAWAVLDGVARSVMMDHRARVRTALRTLSSGARSADGPSADALSPPAPKPAQPKSPAPKPAEPKSAEPRSA
ncbi:hypothetical protein [Streptomyces flavofungini]|uniref:hypothetical protein n=1 Tax=Streptomyces flavofungini TaxID=68200 RepID=UPI0019A86B86|nr:hypothetical protein [Streptomyces flavofungini]GHC73105.1 hypothetical protein GCM10010349_50550 [Streptomyces flavofungini]